ncbi:uncharacterized protein AB9X84_004672 isoform 2-T3 [Acanthopagrus schlegelii]
MSEMEVTESATEPEPAAETTSIDDNDDDDEHPWPYLRGMFSYIGVKDSSYRMKCLLCLPKNSEILAYKNSPSNLRKHVERKHPNQLKKYEELTSAKRKRPVTETPSTSTNGQMTTFLTTTCSAVSQRSLDKAVLKYGLQPLSLVEQEPFIDFNPAELAFLAEYNAVMSPVAQATNILQAEENVQMGWLLPTINLLTAKLDRVKLTVKYCRPLVDALQAGLKTRFGHMTQDLELIAAAILLPKFRTSWTKDDATIRMGVDYIREHLEAPPLQSDGGNPSSSDEEDFFSSLQSPHTDSSKELEGYLAFSSDRMESLKSFPALCKLSLKLNTPLPASAACERLFSIAGLVFSPRRVTLSSRHFENQLLLRLNKKFLRVQ